MALLANPITWIVLGIGALIATVVVCWNKFAGFRAVIMTVWGVIKGFGTAIYQGLVAPFKVAATIIEGVVGALKALFEGDFSGAWQKVKEAISTSINIAVEPFTTVVNSVTSVPDNFNNHLARERKKDKTENVEKKSTPLTFTPQYDNNSDKKTDGVGFLPFNYMSSPQPAPHNYVNRGDSVKTDSVVIPPVNVMPFPQPAPPNYVNRGDSTKIESFVAPPASVAIPPQQKSVKFGDQHIKIDYNPIIHISAEMTQKGKDDILLILKMHASQVVQMVKDELRRDERGAYGLS